MASTSYVKMYPWYFMMRMCMCVKPYRVTADLVGQAFGSYPEIWFSPRGGKPKCSAVVKAINIIKIAATLLTSTFKIFYNYLHLMWMCILCTDPFHITVTASLIGQLLKVRNQNFDHLQRCNDLGCQSILNGSHKIPMF